MKISVMQIITELGDGGVESLLINLYKNMNCFNYKMIFVVQTDKRRYEDQIRMLGGEIIQIHSMKEIGIVGYYRQMRYIFKKYQPNVVHAHNLLQNTVVLSAAKHSKISIRISHSHLTTCYSKVTAVLMPLIRKVIIHYSTKLLACGDEAGQFMYGKKKHEILRNAVDVNKFFFEQELPVEYKNIQRERKIVLNIGRLSKQKNQVLILGIAEEAKRMKLDIHFFIAGEGPEREQLENTIRAKNIEEYVTLLGSRNDIPSLLKNCDLMLLPSLYEGLPVVAIEAQSSGIPSILSSEIDKKCDLGLRLISFMDIRKSEKQWLDIIVQSFYKKNKVTYEEISKCMRNNGYDIDYNARRLEQLYVNG